MSCCLELVFSQSKFLSLKGVNYCVAFGMEDVSILRFFRLILFSFS